MTNTSLVAVLIPVYKKLSAPEQLSIETLSLVLGNRYSLIIVHPESFPIYLHGFYNKSFGDAWFESKLSYARLMINRCFYQEFSSFDYILIYQLDCLVFLDQLDHWCHKGYDYVSSAWITTHNGWPDKPFVGIGGFSLRRISSFIRVLSICESQPHLHSYMIQLIDTYMAEDVFWGRDAAQIDPSFCVVPVSESLAFSFNGSPSHYLKAGASLPPFGCHAWPSVRSLFAYLPYLRIRSLKYLALLVSAFLAIAFSAAMQRLRFLPHLKSA
jgi:hypothetical protein